MSKSKGRTASRKQVVLRLDSEVNRAVRSAAKRAGQSINAYCEATLGRAANRSK